MWKNIRLFLGGGGVLISSYPCLQMMTEGISTEEKQSRKKHTWKIWVDANKRPDPRLPRSGHWYVLSWGHFVGKDIKKLNWSLLRSPDLNWCKLWATSTFSTHGE